MRMTKNGLLAAALLVCLGAASARADAGGVEHARRRLYATDVAQSEATRTQGSARGFTAFVAEDAVLALPGVYLLQGRTAIAAGLAAAPLEGAGGTLRWEPLRWDVSADGKLGYSLGRVWLAPAQPGGALLHGAYVSVWRQDAQGEWTLSASVRNLQPGSFGPVPLEALPEGCKPFHDNGRRGAKEGDAAGFLAEAFDADRAFAAYAATHGTEASFYAFASDEVYVTAAGGSCGREALVPTGGPQSLLVWSPALGDAAATGDLAWTLGGYNVTAQTPSGPRTFYGKYLSVWTREKDGSLRYLIDLGNSSPGGERL